QSAQRTPLCPYTPLFRSVSQQAELLGVNRSSLYYKPVQPSQEEVDIKHRIDEIYTKFPYFGSRKITETLHAKGELGIDFVNSMRSEEHTSELQSRFDLVC